MGKLDDLLTELTHQQHALGVKGLIPLTKHTDAAKAEIINLITQEVVKARVDELQQLSGFVFEASGGIIRLSGRHQRSYDYRIAELKARGG